MTFNGFASYVIRHAVVYLNDDLAILALITGKLGISEVPGSKTVSDVFPLFCLSSRHVAFEYCPARFRRANSLNDFDRTHRLLGQTDF